MAKNIDSPESYYYAGRKARRDGMEKFQCPIAYPNMGNGENCEKGWGETIQRRSQWLAGWHDQDMELGRTFEDQFNAIFP